MKKNAYTLIAICGICLNALGLQTTLAQTFAAAQPQAKSASIMYDRTITGRVADANGEGIVGATVAVKGGTRGTTTDDNGNFTLSVPDDATTLVITYPGYNTQEVTISGSNLVIALVESGISLNDVVVIGSRNQTRTKVETPVPVDIIPIQQVVNEIGQVDINQILTYMAPSFQSSRQAISDGTDHVDPAQMRGLGPDQVLVLVNGKRRHQSALVNVNGTVNRGTVGTDLNAIPAAAIERIEILRDGASAQYGSDAIAGVINIVLKQQDGFIANVSYGINNTSYAKYYAAKRVLPAYATQDENTSVTDGGTLQAGLSYGMKIGSKGHLNVMGEFTSRDRTNRTGLYTGQIWPSVSGNNRSDSINTAKGLTRDNFDMLIGNSKVIGGGAMYNFTWKLNQKFELYSFGGYNRKGGNAAGFYRYPNAVPGAVRSNVLSAYPNGFLPEINSVVSDLSIGAGIRGKLAGWNTDLSLVYGTNVFDFNITNSVNYTQALTSSDFQKEFDAGGTAFRQGTLNADVSKKYNVLSGLNIAFGGEFRQDGFEVRAGEESSGKNYDVTSGLAVGSQVFSGFLPRNAINETRTVTGGYIDIEQDFSERFLVAAAARFENYSDFGSTLNGKLAARFKLLDNLSVRASASTGFRAPSQQQKYYAKANTLFVTQGGSQVPVEAGTFTNYSKPAELLGISPLKEETSINYAAGVTARLTEGLDLTVDFYRIDIKDRIILTNNFTGGNDVALAEALKANNASEANFFANAIDTRSQGIETVLSYSKRFDKSTEFRATLAATFIDNTVIKDSKGKAAVKASETLIRTGQLGKYFNREDQSRIEVANPRSKGNLMLNYKVKSFSVMLRNTYFGEVTYLDATVDPGKPDAFPANAFNNNKKETLDQVFSPKVVTDLTFAYQITKQINFAIGCNNLLDVYQDKHTHSSNMGSGRFVYSRRVQQMGFNGRYLFARASCSIK